MLFWFGSKKQVRRVPNGRSERRRCPKCGATSVFRECVAEREFNAFSVLELWSTSSTVFCCDACGVVVDLDDTDPPELSPREQARAQKQGAREARRAEKRSARERARAAKAAEQAARAREAKIDDELAAIKRKLGM